MGDKKRFDIFSAFIQQRFDKNLRVADIAGGKGRLQTALREKGFSSVVTFDKRRGIRDRKTMRYEYRFFDSRVKNDFDLLLGMHPDEATDVIIKEAARRNVPFVIVPCCIKPFAVAFWQKHSFDNWVEHLIKIAEKENFKTEIYYLKIQGMNTVILGKPKKYE